MIHPMYAHARAMSETHRLVGFVAGMVWGKPADEEEAEITSAGLRVPDGDDVLLFAWHAVEGLRWRPKEETP